jgi:hypothetical protein
MTSNRGTPPQDDELEVSIFGPGYGEALAIHLGNKKWILVDSCIEPKKDLPASLNYLNAIEVEVDKSVRLIVATHWHDDHIRGLALTLGRCENAEFWVPSALGSDAFLKLAHLYHTFPMMNPSGIDEFSTVIQLLIRRRQRGVRFPKINLASLDKLLFSDNISFADRAVPARVYSLSPSDSASLQARLALADLIPREGSPKNRILPLTPNHTSVVLWIEVGVHKLLMGADLQLSPDPYAGWSVILSDSQARQGRAQVFKVPHHGSANAHHPQVWTEMLITEPYALLAPFRRGQKSLPSGSDAKRINGLTPNAYATGRPTTKRVKWRNRVVRDTLARATSELNRVHQKWGHVRMRKKINSKAPNWRVELFGDAYRL